MRYTVPFDDIATGAVADTYKTFVNVIIPDTTDGHRVRLRKLVLGVSDDTPQNANVGVRLKRIADRSAGTAGTAGDTIAATAIPKTDPDGVDAFFTAGRNYSVEPTTYETEAHFQEGFNALGGFIQAWDEDDAPAAKRDQSLALLMCPRTAAAIRLSGTLELETY